MRRTVMAHLRAHVEARAQIRPSHQSELLREWSRICREFVKLIRNRRMMGAMRYGSNVDHADDRNTDWLAGVEQKLDDYRQTGNVESLVDVAHYALLEFEFPSHPNPTFHAVDDGEHLI